VACRRERSPCVVESPQCRQREPALQGCERIGGQPLEDPVELVQRFFIVAGGEERLAVNRVRAGPGGAGSQELARLFEGLFAAAAGNQRQRGVIQLLDGGFDAGTLLLEGGSPGNGLVADARDLVGKARVGRARAEKRPVDRCGATPGALVAGGSRRVE